MSHNKLPGNLSAEEKRALLARLLQERDAKPKLFPLSSAQRRMWILWQLAPDSPVYNSATAVRFAGPVDVALLRRCLDRIVARHETLRTTFMVVNGQPRQMVAPAAALAIPAVDLALLAPGEQEAEILRLATEDARRPFDLTKGPLIRFIFLLLGQTGLVMVVNMHHIVADGWSVSIFTHEVDVLYEALKAGRASPLPELPIQYVDYAVWQQKQLEGEALERQQAYWQRQLAGAPALLELPTDRPRPAAQTFSGATYTFALPAALVEALRKLGRQANVTLFMTLLAAFDVLLWRYTAQEDLLVGTAIANRQRRELEGLIGFFVNTLVLRTSLAGRPRFCDLLQRVRRTTLEAYEHQDLPFEQLLNILDLERDVSHSPLFQVMFTLYEAVMPAGDPSSSLIQVDSGTAMFDLSLALTDDGRDITVDCRYNTDLFAATTVVRLATHFRTLLEGVVAWPERAISSLPILSGAERQQLLAAWNDTQADYAGEGGVHQLFEAQARQTPDAIAVSLGEAQLGYAELNARANRLAHHLRSLGVGPETLVGICLARSVEMIVAVLAALKAGGAYAPLDPTYPQERLAFMARDAQVSLLLTTDALAQDFTLSDVPAVRLDADWPQIGCRPAHDPGVPVVAENLAYVLYTSGSTGRPKGVMIPHRGIANLARAQSAAFGVQPGSRVLQFAPFSFDASVSEIFVSLLSGATLCLAAQDMLLPGPDLVDVLQSQSPGILTCPPSIWAILPEASLPHLQTTISAGEACPAGVAARWARGRRFINAYGPTETTVCATLAVCAVADGERPPPIGRPIDNTRVYLLDGYLEPVPVGIPGEIHVDAVGLARGYLGRPGLTAEKFVPNPFSPSVLPASEGEEKGGARLYRTGDLARYRPDGSLEFLGRMDHQVKVRGFRIELGEVEAALRQQPGVREAVVAAREMAHSPGNKQLVAYLVARGPAAPGSDDLRRGLQQQLPEYMLPSAFVFLDALPLTPGGKVDRQALPAPDKGRPRLEQRFVAPRTPLEQQLAAIWAEVLGLERVGVHDNFFDLGGDSILAIQATARANEVGGRFTLKQLFEHQTIGELVAAADWGVVIEAEQGPVTGQSPLTPIQHWFFAQHQPEVDHFNQAILLAARQHLDVAKLRLALQALGQHHDALRSRFVQGASGWQQICEPPGDAIPLIEVDLAALSERAQLEALQAAAARLHASLDLAAGRLSRAAYFRGGPRQPDRLLIVIHHLVVDGVSWHILLEDLDSGYRQLCGGQPAVSLPRKTTSFKRWATKLVEYARSPALQQERGYWLAEEQAQAVKLPVDDAVGAEANREAEARTVSVSLSADETQALLRQAPQAYNTQINDALLAALAQTLSWWAGGRALLVALEGHGREQLFEDVDLSRTVGWFTTLFPVYLDLGAATDPGDVLKTVKEQLRRVPGRGIGYGLLRYLSGDEAISRRLEALPQAEVSFNYLGRLDQAGAEAWLFSPALEPPGPLQSRRNERPHLLGINSYVANDQLVVHWTYSSAVYRQATIERLADRFITALRAIIAHCLSPEAGGYTPSDFALANLDEHKLTRLARMLEQVEEAVQA